MVNVAQLVEHRTVIPVVESSNLSIHPNLKGVHVVEGGLRSSHRGGIKTPNA